MLDNDLTNLQQNNARYTPVSDVLTSPKLLKEIRAEVMDLIEQATGSRQVVLAHTLIVDFFDGDHNAAILFNQILYWTARTNDPDGWFYKTYDDWYNELRFSAYQIWRVVRGDPRVQKPKRTLWSLGVESVVRMAPNGRNAMYYRLNMPAFMTTFTDWLEATFGINFSPSTAQADPTPHTKNPAQSKKRKVTINPLKQYEPVFGKLNNKTRKTLYTLRNILGEHATLAIIERSQTQYNTWADVVNVLQNAVIDRENEPLFLDDPVKPADATAPELMISANVTDAVNDVWQRACTQLERQMRRDTFVQLLGEHSLVDYLATPDSSDERDLFVIAVKDDHAEEYLTHRWHKMIRRVLSDFIGDEVNVKFITKAKWRREQHE